MYWVKDRTGELVEKPMEKAITSMEERKEQIRYARASEVFKKSPKTTLNPIKNQIPISNQEPVGVEQRPPAEPHERRDGRAEEAL